ncbi:PorT family protein [candidate division KSB1 bacterium]|nr:PorT family protein [candidate division KSB1 bacterium]
MTTAICAQNFRIGVLGGLNFANISTDFEDTEPKTLTTYGFGGVIERKLNENLILCFEPMYLQKGAKMEMAAEEGEDFFGDIEARFEYAYFEIPVFLKVSLGSGEIKPYLMAGPTIGILSSAEMVVEMLDIASFGVDIKDASESIDYGIGLGGVSAFLLVAIRYL